MLRRSEIGLGVAVTLAAGILTWSGCQGPGPSGPTDEAGSPGDKYPVVSVDAATKAQADGGTGGSQDRDKLQGAKNPKTKRASKRPASEREEEPLLARRQAADSQTARLLEQEEAQKTVREEQRKALAENYYQTALGQYAELDYELAEKNLEEALRLNPEHTKAKELLEDVRLLLGKFVPGDERGHFRRIIEEMTARTEGARVELDNHMRRGRRLLDVGDYAAAIQEFTGVLEMIRWFPPHIDLAEKRSRAEALLAKAHGLKQRSDVELARKEEQMARTKAKAEETERIERLAATVEQLYRMAQAEFERERYGVAQALCEQILDLDSRNFEAAELRRIAMAAQHKQNDQRMMEQLKEEWKLQLESILEKTITQDRVVEFAPREVWAEISTREPRRVARLAAQETPEDMELRNSMSRMTVTVSFSDNRLPEVVESLRDQTGFQILIDGSVKDPDSTVVSFDAKNVPFEQVLRLILRDSELGYRIEYGVITIMGKEALEKLVVLELYDVADLTGQLTDFVAPEISLAEAGAGGVGAIIAGAEEGKSTIPGDDLKLLVTENIAKGTWELGDNSIEYQSPLLIVRHTPDVQAQIQGFLSDVRRSTGVLVTIEARFLTVQEHFLEDIGVDFRGLEPIAVPPAGTPADEAARIPPGGVPVMDDFTTPPFPGAAEVPFDFGTAGLPGGFPIGPETGIFGTFGSRDQRQLRGITEHLFGAGESTSFFFANIFAATGGTSLVYTLIDDVSAEAILRAVRRDERSRTLIAPKITVFNTQRANVFVANQVAYIRDFDIEIAQDQAIADPQVGNFQDGIALDVRPTVSADRRYITLELRPSTASQVVDIRDSFININTGLAGAVRIETPRLKIQRVRTTVSMPDGGTILIGGLTNSFDTHVRSDVPFLSQIPLLGFLFNRDAEGTQRGSLLILVKATIVIMEEQEELRFQRNLR